VTQRRQAEADIQRLNAELEARVHERTRQLEAANRELEAFSYSVSHDLRAPLRGIDGWSLALLEDYGGQLDAQARGYLDRVRSEAQRMGQLIDDLLNLARLVRAELVRQPVDLSAIAQKLADHLRATAPERQAAFTIQPGLAAVGDPRLIEIALTNLLGNAFKFTAKADQAQITFGQLHLAGERVFFVRDNGAGFDPALAERRNIFSAFQRLHKASEFPGSGVGLATVQRIIHRHGGRIWAEAALGQGATFFFSLERDAGPASGPAG
jgi:light-regulated signal transduction histidine kinase (bacteriophytochrome)